MPCVPCEHKRFFFVFCAVFCTAIVGNWDPIARGQQPPAPARAAEAKAAVPSNEKPTAPKTSSAPASAPTSSAHTTPPGDARLTFSFRYQPWQQVLDWFAEQAGLSLLMDSPPPGTFNYTDTRTYTPAEALDVLNGVLLTKGYTLVRHGRMLVVVNLEDGIPPNLVPDVPLADLDKHGEYELIRVLFPVWNMTPEQAASEVQPLLGPQGKVVTLPQSREIQVTETGGRLRTIRSIVNAVEEPESGAAGMRVFPLRYITFEAAMPTIRQMLGISAEASGTPDGTIQQITKSAVGEKLLFRGTAQQATRLTEILRLIDVPEAARGVNGTPQFEVYSVTTADPDTVVKMLQMLLRDPTVILTADKEAGHVMASATPPQLATIRATIEQMQKEAKTVDVIKLSNVDPQMAVVAINKLYGTNDEKPDPKAPRVDADITTRSLFVRGTEGQLKQIRELLRKLGETGEEGGPSLTKQQHVRLLPLSGAAARSAISQIEQIWPNVRTNRIRIVSPSAGIPSYRPGDASDNSPSRQALPPAAAPADGANDALKELFQDLINDRPSRAKPTQQTAPVSAPEIKPKQDNDRSTQHATSSRFHLAADAVPSAPAAPPQKQPDAPAQAPSQQLIKAQPPTGKGAPIIIAPGPGGTLIASDDLEALDQLEDLLTTVAGHNAASGREYAVFYLKYSKAPVIAEVLNAIFGGTSGGKDRGIIGDMASNALGEVGGGLMGDLLLGGGGGGGGSFVSGAVSIVPDARLNALVIQAKSTDLDTIEQLLKVLDQRTGPENVKAEAQPRPIPVYNTTAADMAQMIQQLYQDRMAGPSAAMTPQDMMKMIRGGNNAEQQVQKMTIAVDARNNLLIVRAPDALFEEVKAMVTDLDQSNADSPETTKVVSLQHTNSAAVQKALTSLLGNVKTSTMPVQGQTAAAQPGQPAPTQSSAEESPEDRMRRMRHTWEMMQEMRKMQERGGEGERGGSDRGGSDRSRFGRSRGGEGERGSRGGDGRRD